MFQEVNRFHEKLKIRFRGVKTATFFRYLKKQGILKYFQMCVNKKNVLSIDNL